MRVTQHQAAGNSGLQARRVAAVARGVATATPLFAQRAENAEIWDVEGQRYIDFASGIGVLATGHRHPRIVEAVRQQLECFSHTAFQVMAYESYIELAERLNKLAPFSAPAKSVLFTTGAEAVENAVKIARTATNRSAVIAFSGAFHGRTLMTMALTGKVVPYKRGVASLTTDVFRLPFPAEHRGISVDDSMRALEALFYSDLEPSRVAAIIIEPVQGEGGFNVAPPLLLQRLRAICDMHGIALIVDEIQSGFGRTGRMFAVEHANVEPDLVTVAKSLAGGFPLSGVIGRADMMEAVEPGGLGGTYGGSPIGCMAALAVLDVIAQENLIARAAKIGAVIRKRIGDHMRQEQGAPVANLRGLGAMIGFDIVKSADDSSPDGIGAKLVAARAMDRGLILLTCGASGETIRILVPLTVSDTVLAEGLDILVDALRQTSTR